MAKKTAGPAPGLVTRRATPDNVPALVALTTHVHTAAWRGSAAMLQSQQMRFPEGQFVAEYEGQIIGYRATFRTAAAARKPHVDPCETRWVRAPESSP